VEAPGCHWDLTLAKVGAVVSVVQASGSVESFALGFTVQPDCFLEGPGGSRVVQPG
jgi:hypothetical protein